MRSKLGFKPAIIALARKLFMLVYHLLVNHEPYFEEDFSKKKPVKLPTASVLSMTPDQILDIISDAVATLFKVYRIEFVRKMNRIGTP